MDDDARFMIDDEDDADAPELPPEPCPRCGRAHVALFFGQRYRTFAMHGNFFNQSLARVSMRTCMDCGYIELYREEVLKQHD